MSQWFIRRLDETTDVQGLSQLIVFMRYIWMSESHGDLICCEPIIWGTSDDIFNTLNTNITTKGIEWAKRVVIYMDGVRAMSGKNSNY